MIDISNMIWKKKFQKKGFRRIVLSFNTPLTAAKYYNEMYLQFARTWTTKSKRKQTLINSSILNYFQFITRDKRVCLLVCIPRNGEFFRVYIDTTQQQLCADCSYILYSDKEFCNKSTHSLNKHRLNGLHCLSYDRH